MTTEEQNVSAEQSQRVIEEATDIIKLGKDLTTLMKSNEFINVIMQGYLQDATAEVFYELVDGKMSTEDEMKLRMRKIEAINALSSYLDAIPAMVQSAETRIKKERKFLAEQE